MGSPTGQMENSPDRTKKKYRINIYLNGFLRSSRYCDKDLYVMERGRGFLPLSASEQNIFHIAKLLNAGRRAKQNRPDVKS